MPRIKSNRKSSEGGINNNDNDTKKLDPKYNPELIATLIKELGSRVDMQCNQIATETDFSILQLRNQFQLELLKLPTSVKKMSLKKFRDEFGENFSLIPGDGRAATSATSHSTTTDASAATSKSRLPFAPVPSFNSSSNIVASSSTSTAAPMTAQKPINPANSVFETPMLARGNITIRAPKEGEKILSENGSPLGEFATAVKAPRPADSIVPQTPGVFVPLKSGEVLDVENTDLQSLDPKLKADALVQMQTMMDNMKRMMDKMKT